MVFHWPEPGKRDELARSMHERHEVLLGLPGCLEVEPPYVTEEAECLIGISRWESREAFETAVTLRPTDEIVEGETRPRQRFLLDQANLR